MTNSRIAWVVFTFVTVSTYAIVAATQSQTSIADVFFDPACPNTSCWQGIVVGVTTQSQVETILNNLNTSFIRNTFGDIANASYSFSPPSSTYLDANRRGEIGLFNGTVSYFTVPVQISTSTILNELGRPDANVITPRQNIGVIYVSKGIMFEFEGDERDMATIVTLGLNTDSISNFTTAGFYPGAIPTNCDFWGEPCLVATATRLVLPTGFPALPLPTLPVPATVTPHPSGPTTYCSSYTTTRDRDRDGLSDRYECATSRTNLDVSDTDGDRLRDGEELSTYQTNPNRQDTDRDGLLDWEEIFRGVDGYVTNPRSADSDDDGRRDDEEIGGFGGFRRSHPLDADSDNDLVKDGDDPQPMNNCVPYNYMPGCPGENIPPR